MDCNVYEEIVSDLLSANSDHEELNSTRCRLHCLRINCYRIEMGAGKSSMGVMEEQGDIRPGTGSGDLGRRGASEVVLL